MRKPTFWITAFGLLFATGYWLRRRVRTAPDYDFLHNDGPLLMAHRGGEGLWPPNTLYAFQRALEMGCDVLEMDIHTTADGELVVRHDPTVDRTTNGSGAIQAMSLSEIKTLDAGYTWTQNGGRTFPYRGLGITIPTLEEVLTAFPQARLNIDIKPDNPQVVGPFCRLLGTHNALGRVLVGSFHDTCLQIFRSLCPQVPTAAGTREVVSTLGLNYLRLASLYAAPAAAYQIPEYHGRLQVITPRFIRAVQQHNQQVHVWTVNAVDDMQRLLSWGVQGLITDYPDRALRLLQREPHSNTT